MVASRPNARTTSGKKIQASGLSQPALRSDGVDADAEDHGPDVLGGGRLEEVGAAAGAVADVVADEVGDDARVARVVLGDPGLDLADEVGADVGGLRVDAAAQLGEEGHEAGAEAEADDEERRLVHGLGVQAAERREHQVDAQERQRDDEEAGDRPAAHRDLDRLDEAAAGRGGRPDVRLHGDEHADDPRGHRAGRPDQERDRRPDAELQPEDRRVGDLLGLEERDDDSDRDRADEGEDADRHVLAADEGDRALVDRRRDGLHLLGAGVAPQHVAGEVDGEGDGDEPRRQDDELELFGAHGLVLRPPCHAQPSALARPSRRGRGIVGAPGDRRPFFRAGRRGGSGRGRVYQLPEARVKREYRPVYASLRTRAPAPDPRGRRPCRAPILPDL